MELSRDAERVSALEAWRTVGFIVQAENGGDIPAESEELAAAKEVIAAVEALFKA